MLHLSDKKGALKKTYMLDIIKIPIYSGSNATSPSIDISIERSMPIKLKFCISQRQFRDRLKRIQECLKGRLGFSSTAFPRPLPTADEPSISGQGEKVRCSGFSIFVVLVILWITAFTTILVVAVQSVGHHDDIAVPPVQEPQFPEPWPTQPPVFPGPWPQPMAVAGGGRERFPGRPPVHEPSYGDGSNDVSPVFVITGMFLIIAVSTLCYCLWYFSCYKRRDLTAETIRDIERLLASFNQEDFGRLKWQLVEETGTDSYSYNFEAKWFISITMNPSSYESEFEAPSTSSVLVVTTAANLIEFEDCKVVNIDSKYCPPPAYHE